MSVKLFWMVSLEVTLRTLCFGVSIFVYHVCAEELHSIPNARSSITVMDSVPCALSSNAVHVLNVSGQCVMYAFYIIVMAVSLIRMSYSEIVSFNVILQYRQYLCCKRGHMFSLNMDSTSDINIVMVSM